MTVSTAWGQSSETYRYLINATNEMSKAVGQSAAPEIDSLLRVTAQACNALTTLLKDPQFHQDLSRLNDQVPASIEEREQLRRELYLFVSSFLHIEERALRYAGVEERTAKEILWVASTFRDAIVADVTPDQLLGSISDLQEEICQGTEILQSEKDRDRRWSIVKKWSIRIGGVTLIAVDVSSAAFSGGITAPVAAGSAAIGGVVASWNE
tara:strand:+ start:3056 stop:3685 length:630 start_codon:yes stop_codon:yes gene_type:complete